MKTVGSKLRVRSGRRLLAKPLFLILLMTSGIFFSACVNNYEPDDIAVVRGLCFDTCDEGIKVTACITGGEDYITVSAVGSSFQAAFEALDSAGERKIFTGQNLIIAISTKLAILGFGDIIEGYFNNVALGGAPIVFIVRGTAADIFGIENIFSADPAAAAVRILARAYDGGAIKLTNAAQLFQAQKTVASLLPIVSAQGELSVETMCVIKNRRLVCELDGDQSVGAKWLSGGGLRTFIMVGDEGVMLENMAVEYVIEENNCELTLKFSVVPMDKNDDKFELKNASVQRAIELVKSALGVAQEHNADFINFGAAYLRKYSGEVPNLADINFSVRCR